MKYNNLGHSGLKVSELSLGSWITFGNNLDLYGARKVMREAYAHGVNFFDNAEVYAKGKSEELMGQALKDFRREDLVVATKIYWGGNGPNDTGLSWKHLIEGTKASLKRMNLEYLDILFCHRPDPATPIEETVRAIDYLTRGGFAFYWGTSEWSAEQIANAIKVAREINCALPVVEQPQYNMFCRKRMEEDYKQIFSDYGLGATTWSPLNSGILTGKYLNEIPKGSRLELNDWLQKELNAEKNRKVRQLLDLASGIGGTPAQLAIAWCLVQPNVTSVITGASTVEQVHENMKAVQLKEKLTPEILAKIEEILNRVE